MSRNKWYYILMALPLLLDFIIILLFLDTTVPIHFTGETVDRWGSKYELIAIPVVIFIFGYFGRWFIKNKKEIGRFGNFNNREGLELINILALLFLNVLNGIFMFVAYKKIEDLSSLKISSIISILLGLLLIVVGKYLLKTKLNIRTGMCAKWSMQNEITWKKSQQFDAISKVISGLIVVFLGVSSLFNSFNVEYLTILFIILMLVSNILYTYYVAKKYPQIDIIDD